jgi:hypothetical protein
MTHGLVMKVPAPTEFYDALHTEVGRRSTGRADGLLLHVGRVTDEGFEVLEIWESKENPGSAVGRSTQAPNRGIELRKCASTGARGVSLHAPATSAAVSAQVRWGVGR